MMTLPYGCRPSPRTTAHFVFTPACYGPGFS
jgi:hypothetical protein